jgi:hypothetical protein
VVIKIGVINRKELRVNSDIFFASPCWFLITPSSNE